MKKKLDLGLIILIISFLVGIFSKLRISLILKNFFLATVEPLTLNVVGAIILILILGNLLNKTGILRNINSSLETFIKDRRLTLIIPSILMGLLPVAAGAMLSAPVVEESGNKIGLNAETKTFLNYWFRHIWEYVWPIYPALILAAAIVNVPIQEIMLNQFPLTLSSIIAGFIFGIRKIPYRSKSKDKSGESIRGIYRFFFYAWPIFAIIILVLVFKLNLILSLLIIVASTLVTTKIKMKKVLLIIKNSLSWRIVSLIISVMIFKRMLEVSGILLILPKIFNHLGISPLLILFFLPFFIGLLTGVTSAFVGVTFPLLLPFIGMKNPNLTYVMLCYAGGFSGVLLSPLHLCLIVTKDYFKADLVKVYRLIFLPVIFVIIVAFGIVFVKQFFG